MKKLNLNLKKDIKSSVENEGSKKKDTRFLNYFDLPHEGKMSVLIVPDNQGELWTKFKLHGKGKDLKGVNPIRCAYESSGEDCPACQNGFDHYNKFKDTGDKEEEKIAKQWFGRDYTIMSVIVLDSPIDVQESPDGNQVKLMYVPYAIEQKVKEAIIEGQIDQEKIPFTPFVIKKSKNAGGYASYEKSYFAREEIGEEDLNFLDDFKVEQFDYSELDVVPKATTTDQIIEWVEKYSSIINNGASEEEESDNRPARSSATPTSRFKQSKPPVESEPEDSGEEESDDDGESEEESSGGSTGSLRDRLNRLKK